MLVKALAEEVGVEGREADAAAETVAVRLRRGEAVTEPDVAGVSDASADAVKEEVGAAEPVAAVLPLAEPLPAAVAVTALDPVTQKELGGEGVELPDPPKREWVG